MAECYIKIFQIFSFSVLLETSELQFLESSTNVESTFFKWLQSLVYDLFNLSWVGFHKIIKPQWLLEI